MDEEMRERYLREHVPNFVEVAPGKVINEARLPEILEAIVVQFVEENPGVVLRPGLDPSELRRAW
jgi:hypothetical protein